MKKLISLLLVFTLLFSTAACGLSDRSASETSIAETDSTYLFTDDSGREVKVPAQISRIVSSGPLAQIILFAAAPEMFVGLSSKWSENAAGIIEDEFLNLPYLGQLYSSADLNVEELAKANPELIIDIGAVKDSAKEDLDNLQTQTGIPTVFISASLETMPETYRTLGNLLGKEAQCEELAAFCERVYTRTLDILEQVGDQKVKALYIGGEEGLNVLAQGSSHAEMLDMLTNNIAVVDNPSSKGLGNSVDMEQIVLWNPDFIIFAPDSIYNAVEKLPVWSELTAIASDNYVETPDTPHSWMGTPPSVQRYLGMIWLTAVLYPEYCDYDVKEEVIEYYRLFYHCELTEDQYEALTAHAWIGSSK